MIKSLLNTSPSLHISGGTYSCDKQFWSVTKPLFIGRENADITIVLSSLSRRHALVCIQRGSMCTIQDLNSKNGTAINGIYLKHEPYHLKHGDIIVLAGAVEMRYNDPNATPFTRKLGRLSGLWIDPVDQEVWVDAEKLIPPLSKAQLTLLQIVVDAEGGIVTRDEIIAQIWPDHNAKAVSNDAVDSLIKRLRSRLSAVEHGNSVLEVVRARGLRLKSDR